MCCWMLTPHEFLSGELYKVRERTSEMVHHILYAQLCNELCIAYHHCLSTSSNATHRSQPQWRVEQMEWMQRGPIYIVVKAATLAIASDTMQ